MVEAIALGIDYNTFWTLNPRKIQHVLKGFEKRQEFENKKLDQTAWLQGIYFANAIGAMLDKKVSYPDRPFSMMEEEPEKDDQPHPHALLFGAWAIQHNQKFKEKER